MGTQPVLWSSPFCTLLATSCKRKKLIRTVQMATIVWHLTTQATPKLRRSHAFCLFTIVSSERDTHFYKSFAFRSTKKGLTSIVIRIYFATTSLPQAGRDSLVKTEEALRDRLIVGWGVSTVAVLI